jgi:hypothetical protein
MDRAGRLREDDDVPQDEVDDTDMTPDQFRAAAARGTPVRVVRSREEYEAALGALPVHDEVVYVANHHLSLAFAGPSTSPNRPARAAS